MIPHHDFPSYTTPLQGEVIWLVVREQQLLLNEDPSQPLFPQWNSAMAEALFPGPQFFLGRVAERQYGLILMDAALPVPEGFYPDEMRRLLPGMDQEQQALASRAVQLALWWHTHQFCSACGAGTRLHARDFATVCEGCGHTQYCRIQPCVIVLVRRGEQALLARAAHFPEDFMSCLSGFVEPGENLEQAIVREIHEEVGILVGNLRYFGSQTWPFPHSLMVAFQADYLSGELREDGEEIVEARWTDKDSLPRLPGQGSIARALIDDWLEGC